MDDLDPERRYGRAVASLEGEIAGAEYNPTRRRLRPFEGPWGAQVGRSITISPGQSEQLLRLEGSDRDVEVITVQVAPSLVLGNPPPSITVTPRLEVAWGTGAAQQEAMCDLARGCSLSLWGSAIDVTVVYPAGNGPTLKVVASAGYGSRAGMGGSAPQATLTDGPYTLAAVSPLISRIPPYARSAQLLVSDPDTLAGWGRVELSTSSDLAGYVVARQLLDADTYRQATPLPNFASVVRATVAGAGSCSAWILYELAL